MNPSKQKLDEKLAELELVSGVSEHEIESALLALRVADSEESSCKEWQYEVLAFSFREHLLNGTKGMGTYFGPMMVSKTEDGNTVESPSIQQIDEETIIYWQKRAETATNPLLRARYAGLIWDLSERAVGGNPSHSMARIHCEAILRIADNKLHQFEVDVVRKLEHALSVSISLNDQALIKQAKHAIMRYEHEVAEDAKPGLWGFSFDLLVGNKKSLLTPEEATEIINALEERLQRLKGGDPWRCEHAAERLARYYRGQGRESECGRVIRELGSTFENGAKSAVPLAASSWLQHIYQVYQQFNLVEDTVRVARAITDIGTKVRDEMKTFSQKFNIPQDKFDSYVEGMVEGTLEETLERIAVRYIPSRDAVEEQLHDLSKKAPLSFLFTKQLLDHKGRVVATVGSLQDDLDGHVVTQMAQNMAIESIFLKAVLDRAVSKFNISEGTLGDCLNLSPVFGEEQIRILVPALHAYLHNDFLVAIHLFIPQIEEAIRNLVQVTGGAVLKPRLGGGFLLKTLDELLRAEQVTTALNNDVALYFRVLLTDQRGWNIRNDVCHGMLPYQNASRNVADRLLHVLIVLAQLRASEA